MAHTPGPWIVRYDSDGSPRSIELGDGSLSVECDCRHCQQGDYPRQYSELVTCDSHVYGPTRQDAELMAAAPDLLAALKALFYKMDDYTPAKERAAFAMSAAAIKKAEGQ